MDLWKLGGQDARFEESSRTAYIHLPAPEGQNLIADLIYKWVDPRVQLK